MRRDRYLRLTVVLVALLTRVSLLVFVWPPKLAGDDLFYHLHARNLALVGAYQFTDGSPAVLWPPGWPAFLAVLYLLFGLDAGVGVIANAVLGAATVALLLMLGTVLLDARTALFAAFLYALWPGLLFFIPTLYTETFFNFLLVSCLTALALATRQTGRHRSTCFAGAGLLLGACALVRGEPLLLLPLVLLYAWVVRRSPAEFSRHVALVLLCVCVVILPWTYRNYLRFGRFILISANGGWVVYYGNHEGARGGYDGIDKAVAYQARHRGKTLAETFLNVESAAWRDAWEFVRSKPLAWAAILPRKIRQTYGSDRDGLDLLKGGGRVGERGYARLLSLANTFWFSILLLAATGLPLMRAWKPEAKVLVVGVLVTWFVFHLLTIGEDRYHVPEALPLALCAATGLQFTLGKVSASVRSWRRTA